MGVIHCESELSRVFVLEWYPIDPAFACRFRSGLLDWLLRYLAGGGCGIRGKGTGGADGDAWVGRRNLRGVYDLVGEGERDGFAKGSL